MKGPSADIIPFLRAGIGHLGAKQSDLLLVVLGHLTGSTGVSWEDVVATVGHKEPHHLWFFLGADHQESITVLKPAGEHNGLMSSKGRIANQSWAKRAGHRR